MADLIYIGYDFQVSPIQPGVEILMAELGHVGFESFVETDRGLEAYIQKEDWYEGILEDIFILKSDEFEINFDLKEIEQTNWNAKWESNFHPIVVDDQCTVRAPFHDRPDTPMDIVIEPKMSFGTGHHETTHMMIQYLLKENLDHKSVLDMGCGTGVLAIIAAKKGAKPVDAIDIDYWAYENSIENAKRNNCPNIKVQQGDAELLGGERYDLIIANINRNILIQDMPKYVASLNPSGTLLLSGFYKEDIPMIESTCNGLMLKLKESIERGQWVALKFIN